MEHGDLAAFVVIIRGTHLPLTSLAADGQKLSSLTTSSNHYCTRAHPYAVIPFYLLYSETSPLVQPPCLASPLFASDRNFQLRSLERCFELRILFVLSVCNALGRLSSFNHPTRHRPRRSIVGVTGETPNLVAEHIGTRVVSLFGAACVSSILGYSLHSPSVIPSRVTGNARELLHISTHLHSPPTCSPTIRPYLPIRDPRILTLLRYLCL
jgi:hypothetical protein